MTHELAPIETIRFKKHASRIATNTRRPHVPNRDQNHFLPPRFLIACTRRCPCQTIFMLISFVPNNTGISFPSSVVGTERSPG